MKIFVVLTFLAVFHCASADQWAVLVAGSKSFYNYRHQADVCHAYQILINNGLKADNIIVISYDDVANSPQNPYRGKLYNKPTKKGDPGVDVYKGCKVDYAGQDATADNFMAVLLGDATATKGGNGKVLKSTEDDHVFINFVDHGGVGIIAMPIGRMIYESELMSTLQSMHEKQMYGKLVFYMEACESGSMFVNLPKDINIYATSAANAHESSWGTYCPPNDFIDGKAMGSCLGDLYSVNWMEDTESKTSQELFTETLHQQFLLVQKETNKSHVVEWGEMDWEQNPIGEFQAGDKRYFELFGLKIPVVPKTKKVSFGQVDSRDNKLYYLMNQYNKNPTTENKIALREEEISREYFDNKFARLALAFGAEEDQIEDVLNLYLPITKKDCQKTTNELFQKECARFTDYGLKYTRFIVTICESGISQSFINQTIEEICQ